MEGLELQESDTGSGSGPERLPPATTDAQPTRGILKRRSQTATKRGIVWDEDNLMITEAQKSSTMKITEPKTPFIRYDSSTDQLLGSTAMEISRMRSDTELSESLPSELEERMHVSDAREWQSDTDGDDRDDAEGRSNNSERAKRQRFDKLRSQHYNMRDVLQRGRELIEHEDDDNELEDLDRFSDEDVGGAEDADDADDADDDDDYDEGDFDAVTGAAEFMTREELIGVNRQLEEQSSDRERKEVLYKRLIEAFGEAKRKELEAKRIRSRFDYALRERDDAIAERQKAVAQRQKIESLCRELQKENKRIKDEVKQTAAQEQQKSAELSTQLESAMWQIRSSLEEKHEDTRRCSEDTEILKERFRNFLEQYELRERHFLSIVKSKDLEFHICQAKCEQQRQKAEQEASKAKSLKIQMSSFVKTENELRKQLAVYIEKFRQMGKKTRNLEKENANIRTKYETMNKTIQDMADERAKSQQEIQAVTAAKAKLESLCRALQTERNNLRKLVSYYESRFNSKLGKAAPNGAAPDAADVPDGVAPPDAAGSDATAATAGVDPGALPAPDGAATAAAVAPNGGTSTGSGAAANAVSRQSTSANTGGAARTSNGSRV
ncbi:hypothetical protein HK105_205026 [Polyrhizophydium stewartii]|uniref:Uncharacterized protein n=1 Tax=Polyrhizophydium stewartii TaxID=2732419 RepID=A0ABR4N7F5_9FUNG